MSSYSGTQGSSKLGASREARIGCSICGAPKGRLAPVPGDCRCDACGSLAVDRMVQAVLAGDWRDQVEISGVRAFLVGVSDCQASHVFAAAEQYRCDGLESPSADLIAEPSQLSSLPEACFDLIVVGPPFTIREDLDRSLAELHRILAPGGRLIAPTFRPPEERGSFAERLRQDFDVRATRGVDEMTGVSAELYVGAKDGDPLGAQPAPPDELTGYAYHLSRKTGRRIVFCLDGPLSAGDRLPIRSIGDEIVGHVTIGQYEGARASPSEPWAEGFRLPPRATFELPRSLPSGVYALAGKIPFVHRSADPAPIAVLLPSNTATAFNDAGGRSLYEAAGRPPSSVLSFHRPLKPHALLERTWPVIKWFATPGKFPADTTYLIDSDLEDENALADIEVLIVVGRSEYWTRQMREHFDEFVDRGGRALLLCSEVMYWQVRVDSGTHQMFRYADNDPHPDPELRTTVWHHPSLEYPVFPRTGCDLSHGGFSANHEGLGWQGMRVVSPDSPLLADSGLRRDDVVELPDASVWDGAPVSHLPDGRIEVDFGDFPVWRHEVIGYNPVKPIEGDRSKTSSATSAWLVLRHRPDTGTVIHCGTLGWCGPCAVGLSNRNSVRVRGIISRMITLLHEDAWPFSSNGVEH